MGQLATQESELLLRLWSIVFKASSDQAICAELLRGFAPIEFVESVRRRGKVKVSELVQMAQTAGFCERSLVQTIDRLRDDWGGLTAVAKSDIRTLAGNPTYATFLDWVPELTPEDAEALRIKWYVADALYEHEMKLALKAMAIAGYEHHRHSLHFEKHPFPVVVKEVAKTLQTLARVRMEADLAVVSIEVGGSAYKYFDKITGRAMHAVEPILWCFQDAVRELNKSLSTSTMMVDTREQNELFERELQEPLRAVFDSLATLQPDPHLLKEARSMISGDLQMRHITLTGNTIIASQIGGVGNTMQTYAQQINIGASMSDEERQLKQTLIDLRQAIEASKELSAFQKKSSVADVDLLTAELSKPADQQDE